MLVKYKDIAIFMLYQKTKARKYIRGRLCYVFITAAAEVDKMLSRIKVVQEPPLKLAMSRNT